MASLVRGSLNNCFVLMREHAPIRHSTVNFPPIILLDVLQFRRYLPVMEGLSGRASFRKCVWVESVNIQFFCSIHCLSRLKVGQFLLYVSRNWIRREDKGNKFVYWMDGWQTQQSHMEFHRQEIERLWTMAYQTCDGSILLPPVARFGLG